MDPIAHASVALMIKPLAPKAPLWALILATEFPDILFFGLEAAGIEHQAITKVDFINGTQYITQPQLAWSHGLLTCIAWSLIAIIISRIFTRDRRVNVALGLMVFSHWLLDALAYSNLPIGLEGSPEIGAGLVNSGFGMILGMVLEVTLILGGIIVYWRFRKRKPAVQISR
jgi:hypothetical protein